MAKIGRPSKRTPEVEARILDGLSSGMTLNRICEPGDMPTVQSVLRWKREDDDFRSLYARAREDGAEAMVERIVDMADTALTAPDAVTVQGIRQATENLKWAAGKFNRQFGDSTKLEHTGDGGGPVQINLIRGTPPPKGGGDEC